MATKARKPAVDSLPGLHEYSELLIKAALAEDIGGGDITTSAIINHKQAGSAIILAKEDFVLAGLFIVEKVFNYLDKKTVYKANFKDGDFVKKGDVVATLTGKLDVLLIGERVALNFLQRLSGIATHTREFIKKTDKTNARILDTRKTTPCLRLLEKYAVKAGGGYNHRFGLFDCVLIKDNHIAAAGSITNAVKMVNKKYRDSILVEVETTNFKEVREALACGADIIMLDNMDIPKIEKSLKIIKNRALVEVSGGINLDNVGKVAKTGVDFISIGALTHSARAVDISMEVVGTCSKKKPQRSK
ncbi:MAG: carboxylating nicotinate-nucleotide diphosphorylase [Deltaproteobacteria bacterium]|nr:carboxylating nicotinate-nucleotide diphosphorylase [Deltaproteobacteria bacterium]